MENDMKKFWTGIKMVLCVCAAFGWWGVLYPELVLTSDTCRIYGGQVNENTVWDDASRNDLTLKNDLDAQDMYWNLLNAGKGEIRFRSRLFTEWNKFMEAINESDQYGTAP